MSKIKHSSPICAHLLREIDNSRVTWGRQIHVLCAAVIITYCIVTISKTSKLSMLKSAACACSCTITLLQLVRARLHLPVLTKCILTLTATAWWNNEHCIARGNIKTMQCLSMHCTVDVVFGQGMALFSTLSCIF